MEIIEKAMERSGVPIVWAGIRGKPLMRLERILDDLPPSDRSEVC